jgi:hypothetical protein
MRSLFSQSQTPTTPRRAVGFFRSGCPFRLPFWADHSVYIGPASFIRLPFRPSTKVTLTENRKTSTQTIGAMAAGQAVNNGKCKVLLNRYLSAGGGKSSRFCTKGAQRAGGGQNNEGEPNIRLDAESGWAHLAERHLVVAASVVITRLVIRAKRGIWAFALRYRYW